MRSVRTWASLLALLIPIALASASLAPVLLISPRLDLAAYRSLGYASHSRSYWAVPARYESSANLERFDARRLLATPTSEVRLIGAPVAGEGWSIAYEFHVLAAGPSIPSTFGFVVDPRFEAVGSGLRGVRLMAGRDATGAPTTEPVIAVGVRPPYAVAPFQQGRHLVSVSYDGDLVSVFVNQRDVWKGDPGWGVIPGVYPVLDLGAGAQLVSVVPDVEVEFQIREPPPTDQFERSFTEAAILDQSADGRFAGDPGTDAWTALALVMQHRRTGSAAVADALDRWAEGRVADARPGRSWPGLAGPTSIEENVGAPGLALALWARDRGRDDWLHPIAQMIEAAEFTPCEIATPNWCRLGNLQPDGRVARVGDPDSTTSIVSFQFAETAAFVAGVRPEDRRAWIRALADRTYPRLPCQSVATLGPALGAGDDRPWDLVARRSNGTLLLLLGMAYSNQPDDPVWSDPAIVSSLRCRLELFRTQVAGPAGWRDDAITADVMLGGAQEVASRLLAPVAQVELEDRDFRDGWRRLIDPGSGQAATYPAASATDRAEATARVAFLVALLEG